MEKQIDIFKKFLKVFATQHQHGVTQHDCNLGNYILYQDEVYSLDGSRIFVHKNYQPFDRKKSLRFLAKQLIYCKFTLPISQAEVLKHYITCRHWQDKKTDLMCLHQYLNKYRKKYYRKRLVKVINPKASKFQRILIEGRLVLQGF
jgi:hypothetical protein